MSIFNQNTIEDSGDWAVEQLYNISEQPCPVSSRPREIVRKSDNVRYCTVYDLFYDYRTECSRSDYFEHMIRKVEKGKNVEYPQYSRKEFIAYVRKNCVDVVKYRNTEYYSWDWYCRDIRNDIYKTYFNFLINEHFHINRRT